MHAVEVGPAEGPWIEQHLFQVVCEVVTIPDAEMKEFMPAKEEPLEAQSREHVVGAGNPLGHPVIVGVFRFERETLEQIVHPAQDRYWTVENAVIRGNFAQPRLTVGDK